jgi:tyrosyl-tRNA synthetase
MKTIDEQLDQLALGTEQIVTRDELKQKLERSAATGKPLRVKLGCDPTAPDLHLGHGVVLRKLRQFQDLGHKAVLIIGDYTALIGDPTGQNKTRPMLDAAAIDRNAATYFEQAGKILDTAPDKLEIRRNSEWLSRMSFADVIRLASKMTVARMLERDTFDKRHKAGEPISTHEFLYPLMQGHDSVMIEADIELGGTDQTFNNLVGRDLQREAGQQPQVVIILPILEGLDGIDKMSKSKGNYIGLTESPRDMFGKTMSIADDLMWRWYRLLLGKSEADIAALRQGHPMDSKKALACALVAQFHGEDAARHALAEFDAQFSKRDLADIATTFPCPGNAIALLELVEAGQVCAAGKASSRGEIRRLIQQGGVQIDGAKLTDPLASIALRTGQILKIGKRTVLKIQVG